MDLTPTNTHVGNGISDSQADDLYRRAVENDIKDYAIFLTDTAGRVINWNRGAERILGDLLRRDRQVRAHGRRVDRAGDRAGDDHLVGRLLDGLRHDVPQSIGGRRE